MNAVIPDVPSAFRQDDGTPIPFIDAKYEWAQTGYETLVGVARHPNSHITFQDIADALQDETGIRAAAPLRSWISIPLNLVAEMCVRNKEPQLTALVVNADTLAVGEDYAATYAFVGQPIPRNLQRAAADARSACYDHFSRREAAGWDRTRLTGRTIAPPPAPARKPRQKVVTVQPATCPQCHLQLLPSGACGYCD